MFNIKVLVCLTFLGAIFQSSEANVCRCPRNMHKVCGDDGSENGKTYINDCLAACDNVTIKCDGACPCQEARGTFLSLHAIKAHVQLSIISNLSFALVNPKVEEPCKCPRTIMAVCGKNNKTYWNECMAGCDEAEVGCGGRCPCPEPTMEPEVRELWQRLMAYIMNMQGTSRSTNGKLKWF